MKRIGNLYNRIISINNLELAEKKARIGKSKTKDIILFDLNAKDNIIDLHHTLTSNQYKTSKYHIFKIFEGKERIIYKLPYFPDRIAHHAIMNILEPIFISCFISNTYNCIKNRGIHKALSDLNKSINIPSNKYCLKLDINKFYPSINNNILKSLLRKKFKDKKLLCLLDEIIDSTKGVPIGNYLSQFFANFYLTYFDHWIKEELKIKHYFRYCDDIVILSDSKENLHSIFCKIREYLKINLELSIKDNYQIYPIESRGIDFVGYKSYKKYKLLRKSIKKRFIRMIKYNKNKESIASYKGWLLHCNSFNLRKKYLI